MLLVIILIIIINSLYYEKHLNETSKKIHCFLKLIQMLQCFKEAILRDRL